MPFWRSPALRRARSPRSSSRAAWAPPASGPRARRRHDVTGTTTTTPLPSLIAPGRHDLRRPGRRHDRGRGRRQSSASASSFRLPLVLDRKHRLAPAPEALGATAHVDEALAQAQHCAARRRDHAAGADRRQRRPRVRAAGREALLPQAGGRAGLPAPPEAGHRPGPPGPRREPPRADDRRSCSACAPRAASASRSATARSPPRRSAARSAP